MAKNTVHTVSSRWRLHIETAPSIGEHSSKERNSTILSGAMASMMSGDRNMKARPRSVEM
ncbi:MAG: hypothetical protein CW694_03090 [Candidatus Syntrophoarchaeum sp. WYZ-LMO15]|nr:MAG: hypothetical protein CW694_03090 [Candidatus Syntrophoarchaeum sp. WYZ-LMO15]